MPRTRQVASTIPLSPSITKLKPKTKRVKKTVATTPVANANVPKRALNNQLVSFGRSMHARFAEAGIRYLCAMHVDPGFRNGNNTLLIIDLRNPAVNLALSFKVDLFDERNAPAPTRDAVVDRMVDRLCVKYGRMYRNVHVCSIETQLERTAHAYADSKAEHMATAVHAVMRSWGTPVAHFDVGIVHRAYVDLYPPFAADPAKTSKANAAAQYAHNKRCSSTFMKSSVALHSIEREVAALDMVAHIERRLREGGSGSTEQKWDDYGDGVIPALVLGGYITNTALLDDRLRGAHLSNFNDDVDLYLILFPDAPFVSQDIAIHREGSALLLLLRHETFPFMPHVRKMARRTLEIASEDASRYSSWSDLEVALSVCIVDLTERPSL